MLPESLLPAYRAAFRYAVIPWLAMLGVLVSYTPADGPNRRVAAAPVVVAAKEIPEGGLIDRASLVVAMWPVPAIPAGSYSSIDAVLNRVARISVLKGEPLVPGRLAPEGTSAGLEVEITPGKRAYSIRINDASGIAGMIQPNSKVDILVTITVGGDPTRRMATIFMSNKRILAIGANVQRGADGRPINTHVATLELTPSEVEQLAIAANQGSISLVLRGYGDPDSVITHGVTAPDIATQLRKAPVYRTPLRRSPSSER